VVQNREVQAFYPPTGDNDQTTMKKPMKTRKNQKKLSSKFFKKAVKDEFIRIRVGEKFKMRWAALAVIRESTESQMARDALVEYLHNHGINLEEVDAAIEQAERGEAAVVIAGAGASGGTGRIHLPRELVAATRQR
jgi:predicted transcriptional regulator